MKNLSNKELSRLIDSWGKEMINQEKIELQRKNFRQQFAIFNYRYGIQNLMVNSPQLGILQLLKAPAIRIKYLKNLDTKNIFYTSTIILN